MSFNITTNKIDGNIVFVVSGEGKSYRFSLQDARNATKKDPITELTVEAAVLDYLNSIDMSTTSKEAVQGEVTRIELRASASTNVTAGKETADSIEDLSISNTTDKVYKGPNPPQDEFASKQSPGEYLKENLSSFSGDTINLGKVTSPDKTKNTSFKQSSVGTMGSTIGGADLSVFYLAEVPLMEDVLDSSIDINEWRKEIITIELDSVLSISYSTLREKYPVRQIGKSNPVSYTYGPRTIAGHIAFAVFTEDVLMRIRGRARNEFLKASQKYKDGAKLIQSRLDDLRGYYNASIELDSVQLLDSLIPFHLLIMGMNERGDFSKFLIKDVHIVDESQYQGTQHPNILNKVSYMAEDIVPMSLINGTNNTTSSMTSDGWELGAQSITQKWPELKGSSLLGTIERNLKTGHS